MRILSDPQGTPEWLAAKAGKFSASTAKDLMASGRGGAPSTSRANLITKLAVERITGQPVPSFVTPAMMRGTELEPFARAAYEAETGALVKQVGFALHDDYDFAGASLDGIVSAEGGPEFKCPDAQDKHYNALMSGAHADEYRFQIGFQQWVAGWLWTDAASFDPRFPEGLQIAITRVPRDNGLIGDIRAAVLKAEDEVQDRVAKLMARRK
jgi:predicted phage-related endonuclease